MAGVMLPALSSVLQPALRPVLGPPMRGGGGDPLLEAIRALFANGEQGALYYFTEDFAGLYQDAAGTTPVTAVGQPVGLMLDRRFGLAKGPELIPSFDFRDWAIHGTVLSVTEDSFSGSGGASAISLAGVFEIGRSYEIHISSRNSAVVTAISVMDGVGGGAPLILRKYNSETLEGSAIFTATSSVLYIRVDAQVGVSSTLTVDSLRVRELPGNHASQATTTARPTLRSAPLRIDYDGVDDYLRTAFPDLGSDVTIARSIPGVGAQILTGQTIAAGNWDDNVTSCATLVIDRALTGPETALVTAFLNQQAGV